MDKAEAKKLFDGLAALTHHHVVALAASDSTCLEDYASDDYPYQYRMVETVLWSEDDDACQFRLGYTDAHQNVEALGHAANLIAPPVGSTPRRGLISVWIVEGQPRGCPLAHGDDDAGLNEGTFLGSAMLQEPYWQSPQ